MSDTLLYIVPSDPSFTPSELAREQALAFLREISPSDDGQGDRLYGRPRYVKPLQAQFLTCCHCGSELDVARKHGLWLHETLERLAALEAPYLFEMPCCGKNCEYSGLDFRPPLGFASYRLFITNPDFEPDADENQFWNYEVDPYLEDVELHGSALEKLGRTLGCRVTQLWVRD